MKLTPDCVAPVVNPTPVSWRPAPGSWDTIFHVLGPQDRYPYWAGRNYTPPAASLEQYFAVLEKLGIDNALVAHATTQGPDNDIYLDARAQAPDRLFAVVKLDHSLTLAQAHRLHERGVRGTRFALHPMAGATFDRAAFDHVVGLTSGLGWFVQLHAVGQLLPELATWLPSVPANVVLDHYGRVDLSRGLEDDGVRALLALARQPNVWVKMSGADRISLRGYPYDDVDPLASALLEIAPDRLLWGTDWPHTGYFRDEDMPDDGLLFEAFVRMVPDEAHRNRILRDNPRRLLGLDRPQLPFSPR